MNYEISRALKVGKQLTTAQRTSSLFASEPVVLGKVLRRGSRPIILDEERFKQNEVKLRALEKAGSIMIKMLPSSDQAAEAPKAEAPKMEEPKVEEVMAAEAPAEEPAVEVKSEEEIPSVVGEDTVMVKDISSEKPKKNKKHNKE